MDERPKESGLVGALRAIAPGIGLLLVLIVVAFALTNIGAGG